MPKSTVNRPDEPLSADENRERQDLYSHGRFNYQLTGVRTTPFSDLYFFLISAPWWWLVGAAFAGYLGVNLLFAFLYWLDSNAVTGMSNLSFADAFFFSVQTFSTIGYGSLTPFTPYAHLLVTVESFAGLIAVAVGTGIIFAKFSRPSARVAFSNKMVVHDRNGVPTLQFRIANERRNEIFNARLKVNVLIDETTAEGQRMRRFHTMELEREEAPIFTMTWTAFHPMNASSPLHGLSATTCNESIALIIATFDGTDATFLQTVQARKLYQAQDIYFDYAFVDILERGEDRRLTIHHERLHEIQPLADRPAVT